MTTIKTSNFILRPLNVKDTQEYYECLRDPEAKKNFMSIPKNLNETKKEILWKISEAKKHKPSRENFIIEINGKIAGWIELRDLNQKDHKHKATIGYGINPSFRNKGLATKAIKLIIKYAFKKYKLKKITAVCRDFNKASAHVLEKAGFKLEGILRKNKYKNGKYLNDMVWAIII